MTPSSVPTRKFGIQTIQTWTWREMCERWAWFETLGWDSLWLPDHFVPSANNDQPMFEAWTLLSALLPVGAGFLLCFVVTQVWLLSTGG